MVTPRTVSDRIEIWIRFFNQGPLMTRVLCIAFCLASAFVFASAADRDWDDSHLAVPRTDAHPIDTTVFLAEWGIEAAQEQIARWESDPDMAERLMQRAAYLSYRDRRDAPGTSRIDAGDDSSYHRPPKPPQPDRPVLPADRAQDELPDPPAPAADESALPGPAEPAPTAADERATEPQPAPAPTTRPVETAATAPRRDDRELIRRIEILEASYAALQSQQQTMIWDIDLLRQAKNELAAQVNELSSKYEELLAAHEDLKARHAALREDHAALEAAYAEVLHLLETGEASSRVASANVVIQPKPIRRTPESESAAELNRKGLNALDEDRAPEAVRWFLQAAREGSINAANNLGFLYEHGWGTVQSLQEAYGWYMRAAENGHKNAMLNIARLYEEGRGVVPNDDRARFWRAQATMVMDE